jgi:predicted DNA-binding protein (UPF0251 family)
MPRPCCLRYIDVRPCAVYFKPAGIPMRLLEEVVLTLDELESLRLADLEGCYQEQAAKKMKISRPTFSRVVEQARRKVADALIHGKALRLEGGAVVMKGNQAMPARDGTGPMGAGGGMGRGLGGCGRPLRAQRRNGAGLAQRGLKQGMNCATSTTSQPTETTNQDIKKKGKA